MLSKKLKLMKKMNSTSQYDLRFDSPGPVKKTRHISELDIKQNDESEQKDIQFKNQITTKEKNNAALTKSNKTNPNNYENSSNYYNNSNNIKDNVQNFNRIIEESKKGTEKSLNSVSRKSPIKSQKSISMKSNKISETSNKTLSIKNNNEINIHALKESPQKPSGGDKKNILSPNGNQNTDNTDNLGKNKLENDSRSISSYNMEKQKKTFEIKTKDRDSGSSKISGIERHSSILTNNKDKDNMSQKSTKRQLVSNENIRQDDSRVMNISKKLKITTNNEEKNFSKQNSLYSQNSNNDSLNRSKASKSKNILSPEEVKNNNVSKSSIRNLISNENGNSSNNDLSYKK